jgi:multiple PDZ domain protein
MIPEQVLGTVVIHEVYPDGAAAIDGRLKPGDQVLEVNNISLRNITHEQAIQMLRRTPAKVRLLVYRGTLIFIREIKSVIFVSEKEEKFLSYSY